MASFSEGDWLAKLAAEKVCKKDMDKLIMNYFVVEGYKDAAEHFAQESNTELEADLGSIGDRMAIRSAIQSGDVDRAMERVNDLNPEILETNPSLYFHLQQQRLIELIRLGKVKEALDFVQEELPPLCEDNPQLLDELECTLALLAFDTVSSAQQDGAGVSCMGAVGAAGVPPPQALAHLIQPSQRQKIASEVNAAILMSQARDKESKLPMLLKMLVWAQVQLSQHASCPGITHLLTASLSVPMAPTGDHPPVPEPSSVAGASEEAGGEGEAPTGAPLREIPASLVAGQTAPTSASSLPGVEARMADLTSGDGDLERF